LLSPQLSVEERRLLLLSALLLPLRKLQYKFKNKQAPATGFIIRDSIKWRTKDVDGVALLHAQVAELAAVHRELAGTGMSFTIGWCQLEACRMQCCCGGKADSDRPVMHKFIYCDRCCRACANPTIKLESERHP
jgi:hypothetical protein